MAQALRFGSRIDGWLLLVMLAAAGSSALAIAMVASTGSGVVRLLLPMLFIVFSGVVLPLWILADTAYELTDDELLVRSGPLRWRVPLRDVRAAVPSRSWLSAPALSLDRLRIDYTPARSLLISPKQRETFLLELQSRRSALAPASC